MPNASASPGTRQFGEGWQLVSTGRRRGLLSLVRLEIPGNPDTEHNAWVGLVDGMYYSAMVGLTFPFLAVCAIALGANNFMVGMVTSLPAIVALVSQLPGAAIAEGDRSLLRVTLRFAMAHRLGYIVLAIVPLLPLPGVTRAWLFIATLAVINAPSTICGVAWTAMMGQIYPVRLLGTVFGHRSMWCQFATVAATITGGYIIDHVRFPYNWSVIFGLSFVLVMASWYYLTKMRVPEREVHPGRRLPSIAEVRSERRFVTYTIGSLIYHIGVNMPLPVLAIYYVRHLGLSGTWIGIFATVTGLTTALLSRWWGRSADRTSNRAALLRALAGLSPVTLLYLVARGPWTVVPIAALTGVFVAGFNLLIFNTLLETAPATRRSGYVAVFNSLMMATGMAPMLGVAVYERWGLAEALAGAAMLRVAGWAWLRMRMADGEAQGLPAAGRA
jgi:MFS family permease